jgi:hypothetical protein
MVILLDQLGRLWGSASSAALLSLLSIDMGRGDSLNGAVRPYLANTRTALHAARRGTPNWPVSKLSNSTPTIQEVDHAGA